jgi:hypothetical protein
MRVIAQVVEHLAAFKERPDHDDADKPKGYTFPRFHSEQRNGWKLCLHPSTLQIDFFLRHSNPSLSPGMITW